MFARSCPSSYVFHRGIVVVDLFGIHIDDCHNVLGDNVFLLVFQGYLPKWRPKDPVCAWAFLIVALAILFDRG